ncbi:hypothetical protein [Streptomyces sp. H27-D2]|uniref:hypothetical protein n=1 Tax=Streptomyces sp. H27-D2 TaxID=3046304 RepID=UPI002DBD7C65|nr:hypothetical protein [Streptomyces sp. H27-D2]MEC4020035.1 hypothetical protein [Streptomyces sp. H27-D2]
MRKAAQITGAAFCAAVLMTGCSSSDGDSDKETGERAPSASGKPSATAAPDAGGDVKAADLKGGWTTSGLHADKGLLILSIAANDALLVGKTSCTGKVVDTAQPVTLNLTCKDSGSDYAKGTVKSADAKTLKITWASGKEDTFTKSDMPSDMPTGLTG